MSTRTAARRRQDARIAYDAFLAECPTRRLVDRIGDEWVTLILPVLADGPQRYPGLSRRIAGVSQKMLTQTLRALERDGLVSRHVTPPVPVRVDHELTPLGTDLMQPIRAIKHWSEIHMDDVLAARARYDARDDARDSRDDSRGEGRDEVAAG